MARTYVQDARAEAAAAKRLQVLDAAIDMLASEPLPRVTLDAVARRAGAGRSTVYVMFGSARRVVRRGGPPVARAHRLRPPRRRGGGPRSARGAATGDARVRAPLRRATRRRRALWSWADLDTDAAGAFAVLDGGREPAPPTSSAASPRPDRLRHGRQSRRGRRRALPAHVVRHLRPALHGTEPRRDRSHRPPPRHRRAHPAPCRHRNTHRRLTRRHPRRRQARSSVGSLQSQTPNQRTQRPAMVARV